MLVQVVTAQQYIISIKSVEKWTKYMNHARPCTLQSLNRTLNSFAVRSNKGSLVSALSLFCAMMGGVRIG